MKNNAKYQLIERAYQDYNESIVKINHEKIKSLDLSNFTFNELTGNEILALKGKTLREVVAFLIGLNSINYQYWNLIEDKFYRYSNNDKVGALAAFEGFEKMWNAFENHNIYFKLHSIVAVHVIQRYFGDIPEQISRIEIFKESMNKDLLNKCFVIIKEDIDRHLISTDTAEKIAQIMPLSFKEPYLKKIQLALYEIALHARSIGYDVKEDLTVAADYQLPKVLEAMGIINYSNSLYSHIENQKPIAQNSKEEKAIRAATIIACENISSEHNISIPTIDRWLWLARNDYKNKKFHLTKTTAY